jgi:hypothetical protein
MGTQQLLLLVLGVIIVGIAIAVGITMFHSAAYHANEQAIVGDLTNYGTQAIQFWKTPLGQGGAGHIQSEVTMVNVSQFLGFTGSGLTLRADDGIFRIADIITGGDSLHVVLEGIGKFPKHNYYPFAVITVDLKRSIVTSVIGTKQGNLF